MIKALLSTILSFLVFLILHVIDFHFFIPQEKVVSLLWTAYLGLFVFGLLYWILPAEDWFQTKLRLNKKTMERWIFPACGVLFYGFLLLGYLEFYFTADRSITFRMLIRLLQKRCLRFMMSPVLLTNGLRT
jgi:hypothetical protein